MKGGRGVLNIMPWSLCIARVFDYSLIRLLYHLNYLLSEYMNPLDNTTPELSSVPSASDSSAQASDTINESEPMQDSESVQASESMNVESLMANIGRSINGHAAFPIEITPDRTKEDIFNNRPGKSLREKILGLPESPGVYMYIDKNGEVIYVGKAKVLKRRVTSYFNRRHDA